MEVSAHLTCRRRWGPFGHHERRNRNGVEQLANQRRSPAFNITLLHPWQCSFHLHSWLSTFCLLCKRLYNFNSRTSLGTSPPSCSSKRLAVDRSRQGHLKQFLGYTVNATMGSDLERFDITKLGYTILLPSTPATWPLEACSSSFEQTRQYRLLTQNWTDRLNWK